MPNTLARTLAVALLVALPGCAESQAKDAKGAPTALTWADSVRREIDAATIADDMPRLRAARALAERALTLYPDDALLLHYQGYALYREAMAAMARGQTNGPLLQQASSILERAAARHRLAETGVILASVYGNLIGLDPSQAMTLGMRSTEIMSEAASVAPSNPRVWLMKGVSAMYTPEQYGGGLPTAEKYLTMAIGYFEKDRPAVGAPAWGKAEVHAWLGQLYEQTQNPVKAAAEYRAALAIEPNYVWVKTVLLPRVAK